MFEIYQSEKTKQFHFRLKAANGQVILMSQAYHDKKSCAKGIVYIIKHGSVESAYEIEVASDGRKYFVLRCPTSGNVIGMSQKYKSNSGIKNGIMAVGNSIIEARMRDLCAS